MSNGKKDACDRCGKDEQKSELYKCTGCDWLLCQECYAILHPPSRKGHHPQPKGETTGSSVGSDQPYCTNHQFMPLDHVCLKCMKCVCSNCIIEPTHRNCFFIPIDKFPEYFTRKVKILEKDYKELIEEAKERERRAREEDRRKREEEEKRRMEKIVEFFNEPMEKIESRRKILLEELEEVNTKIKKKLDERMKEFNTFLRLWSFANETDFSRDGFIPVKRCGAMYKVEEMCKTIEKNTIASVIEVNEKETRGIIDKIMKLGVIEASKKARMPVIPTCSYNGLLFVPSSFMSSAHNRLDEIWKSDTNKFKDTKYGELRIKYPVLIEAEKWIKALPLMCVCKPESLSTAIKFYGFIDVKNIIALFII